MAENFMRSAKPPTTSAGVMAAKVSWNMAKAVSGMLPDMEPSVTPWKKALDRPPMKPLPGAKARL